MWVRHLLLILPAALALPYASHLPPSVVHRHPILENRAGNHPSNQLWNESDPSPRDVQQKKKLDCWWKAGQAGVAHVNPQWIKGLFHVSPGGARLSDQYPSGGDSPRLDNPTARLYDPDTLEPHDFTVSIDARNDTEDKGLKGYFWPDAQTQALYQLSETPGVDTGKIEDRTGYMHDALTMLTGLQGANRTKESYGGVDGMWDHFRHCNNTPIMFQTGVEVQNVTTKYKFGFNHVYPVTAIWGGEEDGTGGMGQRWVQVRNVWGQWETYKLEDVWTNAIATIFLSNWTYITDRQPA